MRTRTTLPFRAAPLRVEDPPSHGTILNAFLSSLALEERSACAVLFGAAARHFLHWLELHGIAIRVIDDRTVQRFEKHRCRCPRYSAQQLDYKADIAAPPKRRSAAIRPTFVGSCSGWASLRNGMRRLSDGRLDNEAGRRQGLPR